MRGKFQTAEKFQTAPKISNGQKIARIAPIWTKICQNRSQRQKLSFEKVFRAKRAQKQRFQIFFRASRGLNKEPCRTARPRDVFDSPGS